MIAEVRENKELNGVEIYFNEFPSKEVRESIKANGFRWNHKKVCWYAKANDKTKAVAEAVANGEKVKTTTVAKNTAKKAVKKNKFGVKVGDVFHMSWGYEQTNNDWFQVVALAGESSVRVVEVVPELVKTDAVSPMSENRTVNVRNCARVKNSMWIKDQEKGDLKRLKSCRADGTCPQFYVTSYADAYLVSEDVTTVYDSWYY